MTEPKPIPLSEWRYLPEDLLTHAGDFKTAIHKMIDLATTEADASYWKHQLDAIDRALAAVESQPTLASVTPDEAESLVEIAEAKANSQIEYIAKFAVGMAMMNMGISRLEISTEDLALLLQDFEIKQEAYHGTGTSLTYTLTHKDAKIEEQRMANGYASDAGKFDNAVIDRMAQLLKQRLTEKRVEGKGGWQDKADCSADVLRAGLQRHLDETGDHLNVIAYAMMLHYRGDPLGLASLEA